jgi:hypothetical protein
MNDAVSKPPDDDKPIGLRTAVNYAVLCFLVLGFAGWSYGTYLKREEDQRQAQALLSSELAAISHKTSAINDALGQIDALKHQIATLPSSPDINKDELIGKVDKINESLTTTRSNINTLNRAIMTYQRSIRPVSFLSPVTNAWAQGRDNEAVPLNIKIYFAIAAFFVIMVLMGYCLWMIVQPHIPQSDKRWAKDLLNKQLVFLVGVCGGIVIK